MPRTVFIVLIYFRTKYLKMLFIEEESNYETEDVHSEGGNFEKIWGNDGKNGVQEAKPRNKMSGGE